MNETREREQSHRQIRTAQGYTVYMPKGFRYTKAREEMVEQFAQAIETSTGQQLYAVFFNRSYESPANLHGINFVFRNAPDKPDEGTPDRFEDEVDDGR